MKLDKNKKRSRAFGGSVLLEALLSVVILSVSITIIIQSMMSSLRAAKYSEEYIQAIILLENKMTEIISRRILKEEVREEGAFSEFGGKYEYLLTATPLYGGDEGLSSIAIDISWAKAKRKKKISAHTFLPLVETPEYEE